MKVQRLLENVERRVQVLQGKGWGTPSIHDEISAALPFIPANATIFDIGANIGEWTKELLSRAGDKVKSLHAFEPAQSNIETLTSISEPRLTIVQAAVSARDGVATLYTDEPGSALASLTKRDLRFVSRSMETTETVKTMSLDRYCDEHGIARIDFLKMDIEGHELDALAGASGLLERKAVRAMAFEFGGCNIDTRTYFKDFFYLLRPLGFRIWRVNPYRKPTEVTRYTESLEVPMTSNFVAAL